MTNLSGPLLSNDAPSKTICLMNDTTQLLTGFGGLAVFAAVFADQVGLPIPAPPLLLAAGALAAAGKLDPALVVGMTALAAVLADSIWFCLGCQGSGRVLRLLNRWSLARNSSNAQAKLAVARHGLWALAAAKFLPGTVVPSLAGALGMSTRRFLLFDGLASLFYGGSYVTAGFLFHNQVQQVMVWFDRVGHGVLGAGLVLVVGYLAYKYALRHGTKGGKRTNCPDKKTALADQGGAARYTSVPGPDAANLTANE